MQFFAKSKFILTKPRFLTFKMLVFQRVVLPNINFSCHFPGCQWSPGSQVPHDFEHPNWLSLGSQTAVGVPRVGTNGILSAFHTPWRIHGTGIPGWLIFYGKLVGKYTYQSHGSYGIHWYLQVVLQKKSHAPHVSDPIVLVVPFGSNLSKNFAS